MHGPDSQSSCFQIQLDCPPAFASLFFTHISAGPLKGTCTSSFVYRTAWDGLTEQEKKYTHYFAKAAWAGAKICAVQLSEVLQSLTLILCNYSF
jgi:hypothetical protein